MQALTPYEREDAQLYDISQANPPAKGLPSGGGRKSPLQKVCRKVKNLCLRVKKSLFRCVSRKAKSPAKIK